ncbi:DnaD domain protein [Metamycoplasma auris]|uniref:Replicative DNA helicase loader DnaB n=1 Tax=Metamycoplasma auris TaxID=51363 RepID=A0A2W7G2W4_9BACT|nr:DnaD domain protein [Metamycoplasma auris]PZW00597.1 replicative DNA helicase loader DnaB [Metamycoplasma auris]
MQNYKFWIDNAGTISSKDLVNLRTFYTPIIGNNGIAFYHHLYDLYNINKEKKYDLVSTMNFLILDFSELQKTKNELEAIGLIKTFQDINGDILFRLIRPLNANEISNNILISSILQEKIGQENYYKIIQKNANYTFDENKLNNISKSFFDIFDTKKLLYTQDIKLDFKLKNDYQLMNSLSAEEYIHYYTKRELSPSQILMLKKIKLMNFSDSAINSIIKYSIAINNSIVCNYIEKIANDFAKRNLFEADMIDNELNQASLFKNRNLVHSSMKSKDNNAMQNDLSDGLAWDD